MKHIIITGHYGSGKSNIACNIALQKSGGDIPVFLIDADIVNPYFRSFDSKDFLEKNSIQVLAPLYANTNLDIPALPAEIQRVFAKDCFAVWDIGGDDAGATVLGRYAGTIAEQGYEMLYVLNFYRPLTKDCDDTLQLMHDIERTSHLRVTGLVNNSNLGDDTSADNIALSLKDADDFSNRTGLPIQMTTVNEKLELPPDFQAENLTKISILTKRYW